MKPGSLLAAHNAEFERGFLQRVMPGWVNDHSWICTLRCARHAWPELPSHANQFLRYHLELEPALRNCPRHAPHRALGDTIVTAHLLLKLLERYKTPGKARIPHQTAGAAAQGGLRQVQG